MNRVPPGCQVSMQSGGSAPSHPPYEADDFMIAVCEETEGVG